MIDCGESDSMLEIYIYIYIYIKLTDQSWRQPKDSLSNSYSGGATPFLELLQSPLTHTFYAECWGRRHQVPFLESLVWLNLELNPSLLGHWRTLPLIIYSHFHGINYCYLTQIILFIKWFQVLLSNTNNSI